jgi:hypothetical protein
LAVLVAGLLLVRVEAIAVQMVLQVNTVPVLVAPKHMATHLVLVVQRVKPMPVVAVVAIGVVGARVSRRN